ncbi:3-oxoacyl-[acyl-carrier-protein] reductase [Schizosaccharomyces pombe]|uniref:Uncharacterized oxidoreductase C663.06c n=1 Tax=Schizosaccharomyces pombe (strain 972 / ATCC 24843) TaxID=284812 RepID=YCP6_SCHPO|nr:putative dehydrogenase [Schizosaccharomyces pombe]Q7Z9I4.1 RecName: Full=Uncharacterized oxidoreductase C663.06c [Schizosaccharomyces pombe 972h-]CAA20366.1 short chain dehydrogenase (predicted) [Schizosaccharomyces pombe]|eukprot:NP_588268.1 putative dehydrogenase [Schizosaccharomyces pombe]
MSTTNKIYFIAGGNRGIGLSLVKELSNREGTVVFASARKPEAATELQEWSKSHSNVHIIKLDISSLESANEAAQEVAKAVGKVDVLWVNSGIFHSFNTVLNTPDDVWNSHYKTNVLGPIHVYQAFYPLVKKGESKIIVFTSSLVGSMGAFFPFNQSGYGQSKAALNFTMKEISFELQDEGFIVISIHPGMVRTDSAQEAVNQHAEAKPEILDIFAKQALAPDQSASDMLKVVDNLKPENNGFFFNYDGTTIPY